MRLTTPSAQSGTATPSLGRATRRRLPSKPASAPSLPSNQSCAPPDGAASGSVLSAAPGALSPSGSLSSSPGPPGGGDAPDSAAYSGSAGNAASSLRESVRRSETPSPSGARTPRTPSRPPP